VSRGQTEVGQFSLFELESTRDGFRLILLSFPILDQPPKPQRSARTGQTWKTASSALPRAALVAKSRGILAADGKHGPIKRRFDTIKPTPPKRIGAAYRGNVFTAPVLRSYNPCIMYDETIRQKTQGRGAVSGLSRQLWHAPRHQGDLGAKPLAVFPAETITKDSMDCARGERRGPGGGGALRRRLHEGRNSRRGAQ